MKYGPFDGRYFKSKRSFYMYISSRVIHHKYRIKEGFLPKQFQSTMLAEALFRHHPDFIDRTYSNQFSFIPIDVENTKYMLCVCIDDEKIPFMYKKILSNA